jgi:hypothetical protein
MERLRKTRLDYLQVPIFNHAFSDTCKQQREGKISNYSNLSDNFAIHLTNNKSITKLYPTRTHLTKRLQNQQGINQVHNQGREQF